MSNENQLALVQPEELSLVENNSLNQNQLAQILKKTPAQFVKKRPAKGGGEWEYVSGGYIKKCLNLMFGWDWDFEIVEHIVSDGEAIVKGRLTCRSNGKTIVKMQYGNKDVMYKKQSPQDASAGLPRIALSIGNDLKAAATDCLKKCASEIGLAADIYNKEDFREVKVDTEGIAIEEIKTLFELKRESLSEDDIINIERIIKGEEKTSYKKILKFLKSK
jgi:hypothetical protein